MNRVWFCCMNQQLLHSFNPASAFQIKDESSSDLPAFRKHYLMTMFSYLYYITGRKRKRKEKICNGAQVCAQPEHHVPSFWTGKGMLQKTEETNTSASCPNWLTII